VRKIGGGKITERRSASTLPVSGSRERADYQIRGNTRARKRRGWRSCKKRKILLRGEKGSNRLGNYDWTSWGWRVIVSLKEPGKAHRERKGGVRTKVEGPKEGCQRRSQGGFRPESKTIEFPKEKKLGPKVGLSQGKLLSQRVKQGLGVESDE